jgi:HlyD family secretion protein
VDAVADKTFTGKVVGVDRTGTVTQGVVNYQVLVSLDITDDEILPNMNVTADIILSSKPNVLVVPAGAVSQMQGQDMVMVLVGEKSEPREIEVGLKTTTQVEVVSGLKEGEMVVTGQRQEDGEGTQFGQSRMRFGGGALRPGGMGSGGGSGPPHP